MSIFDETYRVLSVEDQCLVVRGLNSGEVLTITNANPVKPLRVEDYPVGQVIKLSHPESEMPN
ncbi:MAG TPA: hypothetical protein VFI95_13400 [Terriglobales bacterium]|nr:hypothetical protein [Terriglobales bacterium]